MKNVYTFLFGAGAEVAFGMPSGKDFAKEVLLLDNGMRNKVKIFYENQLEKMNLKSYYKNNRLIYAASRAIYYQTLKENYTEFEKYCADLNEGELIKKIFDDYDNQVNSSDDTSEENKIYKEKFDYFCKNIWTIISKNELTNDDKVLNISKINYKSISNFILDNIKYYSQIDKQFNYLREFEFNSSQFWTVLNTYAAAFFSIYQKAYDASAKLEDIVKKINETSSLCNQDRDSYYKILSKWVNNHKNFDKNIYLLTTNYTSYLEKIMSKDVVYLNGKIGLFEDINNLTIYNSKENNEILSNFVFPFLFVQSGIKPLICTEQIKQYSNVLSKLEKSNYLIVVGYNFNDDDNHINSIICEWLRKDKKRILIYCLYIKNGNNKFEENTDNSDMYELKHRWLDKYKNQIIVEFIREKSCLNDFNNILNKYIN